ncbi:MULTISPECIES: glycosyltransferase family 2 protein [Actinomyces]|uniref:Glycosyltransferase n=1 Tax=Actinomyces respiraculi TaxID=2744574 RepID=A0A7T0PXP9_9ACTO|nr:MULTISPECIES: glycosyltransferase [Actinomyces]QPL06065.1 glycosyltransferase [Actinomyces respiraculi]
MRVLKRWGRTEPRVSLVCAVYGVERYLPRFFASLDAQDLPHERLQVVLVLDGACDNSPAICREWAKQTDIAVQVVEVGNGGQGRARNIGIREARGEWIGFPDPDDVLEPGFLKALLGSRTRGAGMLIGRTIIQQDGRDKPHPLDFRFEHGVLEVDVKRQPVAVQLSVHECLVWADLARRCAFPEDRGAPTFEDACFVGQVRRLNSRAVLVPQAVYHYEKRSTGDSAVQSAWAKPGRYLEQMTTRYLPYLEAAGGAEWAQQAVLYDLGWYFMNVDKGAMPTEPEGIGAEHVRLMRGLVAQLDPRLVVTCPWGHLSASARARILLMQGWEEVAVVKDGKVVELYTAAAPAEATSTTPANYGTQSVGFVTVGADAEETYSGGHVPRVPVWPRRPRLVVP